MQTAPIPTLDDAINQVRSLTADVVARDIIPNEHFLRQQDRHGAEEWARIICRVKQMGLVPAALHRVVDRAIQVHGALGVSADTPLEGMYRAARVLRLADGPDEVHRILIAKNVLERYHTGESWDFGC